MSKYICNLCKKEFTTNYGLKKHINKKTPCIINSQDQTKKFQCDACKYNFSSNQMLKVHILKSCQIIKNKKLEESTNIDMQNKIDALTETVNELKTIIQTSSHNDVKNNTTINNTNCNNTINNITQNIQINSFSKTDITKDHILNAFLKELSAAAEYSKMPELEKKKSANSKKNNKLIASGILEILDNVYLDPKNNNVYLYKKDRVKVYENEDWKIQSLESVNRELFRIVIETIDKIKQNITIPRCDIKYEMQPKQISETLYTLPLMYWNNISEIIENSELRLSILLESNAETIKNNLINNS